MMVRPRRSIATVLFTDIVGSTERAVEMGDHAWHELLDKHHTVARREIRRFGGREINTTGDGFLVRFARPARAIRCAAAIRDSVEELDLEIRAGIHMGAVELHGRDLGGVGVHIGARIAGRAGPGEILVSNAVRESETGSGFEFADRGEQELKGIPGKWRLYAVGSVSAGRGIPWTDRWVPAWAAPRGSVIAAAVALLVISILIGRAYMDRGGVSAIEPVAMSTAAPAIAVLPFEVRGEEQEVWREGMVDVLSANLDGVGGLRAIDSRTVLASWREIAGDRESLDRQRMLEVAGRSGARYAVIGSLVVSGEDMRFMADVHDVADGRTLGEVRVDGTADSIFGVVDRATVQLLDALFRGERDLPDVDLARVTTTSLEALEAFIEAEALYRQGDFGLAAASYRRATEADSTFALAHYRLMDVYGWLGQFEAGVASSQRAKAYVDRLNRRDALIVRANADYNGLELLREATSEYPDDAEAWYKLGDLLFHQGGRLLVPPAEWPQALERSIELDPKFAPPHVHLIHAALRFEPDSAVISRRVGRYLELANGNAGFFGLFPGLAFGDDSARARAISALDTLSAFLPFEAVLGLPHPRFYDLKAKVLAIARERPGGEGRWGALTLATHRFNQGRIAAAVEAVAHPALAAGDPVYAVALAHAGGLPIPHDVLDRYLTPARASSDEELLAVGAWAVERGRFAVREAVARELDDLAEDARTAGDSLGAREVGGAVKALEGFEAWKDGRLNKAEDALELARLATMSVAGRDLANMLVRWWLADLNEERVRDERAAEYLLSLAHGAAAFSETAAVFRLARVEEKLGRHEDALANYEWVLEAWKDSDPELGSWVEEARQAVIRLRGLKRE